MQVLGNEKVLPVDIDGTLIKYVTAAEAAAHTKGFTMNYGGKIVNLIPRQMNIAILTHCKLVRDKYILVWSANGKEWAADVIRVLKLEAYVDLVMTKPYEYLDDKDCNEWMCSRIDVEDV